LLPANIYSQYIITSATLRITYTGRMDIVSGVLGIGIGLNQQGYAQPTGNLLDNAADVTFFNQFGQFNLVDDLYFSKVTQAVNGARAIWFPIDDRQTQFVNIPIAQVAGTNNGAVLGYYIVVYGANLPASAQCLRFDFIVNYEATVLPAFSNYIPQDISAYSKMDVISATSQVVKSNPELVTQPSNQAPAAGFLGGLLSSLGGAVGPLLGGLGSSLWEGAKKNIT